MEFIELADYPVPGGRVIEWLPASAEHWANWQKDPRGVSYNHEQHLRDALDHSRIRDRRHYWLGHAFRVDGPLDAQAWRAALDQWIDRHEGLRTHVTVEDARPARYTAEPGDIRVEAIDAGTPVGTMAAYRVVQRLLDEATSPLRWPAYVCVTIGAADSFTVILAADHSVMDGYSTITTGGELRALYDAIRAGDESPEYESGSYLDFCDIERQRAAATTAEDPGVAIWREFLDRKEFPAGAAPDAPLRRVAERPIEPAESAGPPARVPQRNLAIEVLDAAGAETAATAARTKGHGLFAVLLAAFAATTAEFGNRDFRTVVPLHTRSEPQWADTLGWFVGLAPVEIDCAAARTLRALLAPAGAELRRVRAAAAVPFGRVCELLAARPRISFMVSYMDIRAVAAAEIWADTDTRWLRSRNSSADEFFFWFMRTPTGVTLNMRYPGTAKATRDVHRHVLRMRALLAEFVRAGDAEIRPSQGAPLSWK